MTHDDTRHTIFLSLAGSQAHGTAREGSDVDVRGICIAPLRKRLSLFETFEQYEGPLPTSLEPFALPRIASHPTAAHGLTVKLECVLFDIAKLVRLAAEANPNALELLFAAEEDWLVETPAWRTLHASRHVFLTKHVQRTFLAYALAQLKRIRTHRGWLLSPPTAKPTRAAFGLPESSGTLGRDDLSRIEHSLSQRMRSDDIDAHFGEAHKRDAAAQALGLPPDLRDVLDAEKRYRAALKHFNAYESWKRERNPARAALERAHGYDTKHAMHLIRLMRMGLEALETGELHVRRADAAELRAIRDGALTFDALSSLAGEIERSIARAAETTRLPEGVDHAHVDELCYALMADVRIDARPQG